MKGAVLAGGKGTRLYPLTHATNKHLLPVYDKPMIYYPIQTLVGAGITDIMVVAGGEHAGDFIHVLRNGDEFGIEHLEYAYQDDDAGGIADALRLCEDFADGKELMVILGDNTTDADIRNDVDSFSGGAHIFLKKVSDPQRYGVALFAPDDSSTVVRIEEKPQKPRSDFAVTGLYVYDSQVFDYIRRIRPSHRGQLEITDVNNLYIQAGTLRWTELQGFWSDAGTFESLYQANKYWAEKHLAHG